MTRVPPCADHIKYGFFALRVKRPLDFQTAYDIILQQRDEKNGIFYEILKEPKRNEIIALTRSLKKNKQQKEMVDILEKFIVNDTHTDAVNVNALAMLVSYYKGEKRFEDIARVIKGFDSAKYSKDPRSLYFIKSINDAVNDVAKQFSE